MTTKKISQHIVLNTCRFFCLGLCESLLF